MFYYVKKSLTLKIIIMIISILIPSFIALSFFTVQIQTGLLEDMIQTVDSKLKTTGEKTQEHFKYLESNLTASLENMKEQAACNISESTEKAITTEEEHVKRGMDEILYTNTKILADLLHTISQPILMEEKYEEIRKFSSTVAESKEVIYAFFLDNQGKSLINYVDYTDDRIDKYLEKVNNSTNDEVSVVIEASRKDPTVLVYEKKLQYFGIPKGEILLCVARDSIDDEMKYLESRFEIYKKHNTNIIQDVINNQSGNVIRDIKANLKKINQNNSSVITDTAELLKQSVREINQKITQVIIIVGAVCSVLILIFISIVFKFMILKPIKDLLVMMSQYSQQYSKDIPIKNSPKTSLSDDMQFILTKKNMNVLDAGTNPNNLQV